MTFREKLQQEHPERIRETVAGGCMGCPCDYQYEDAISCDRHASCEMCWDREIPDNEQPPKFGEWISVKERLPENDGSYLVIVSEDKTMPPYVIIRIFYNGRFEAFTEPFEKRIITHWMPLPPTPEVGE